jgi:hypothetical protein
VSSGRKIAGQTSRPHPVGSPKTSERIAVRQPLVDADDVVEREEGEDDRDDEKAAGAAGDKPEEKEHERCCDRRRGARPGEDGRVVIGIERPDLVVEEDTVRDVGHGLNGDGSERDDVAGRQEPTDELGGDLRVLLPRHRRRRTRLAANGDHAPGILRRSSSQAALGPNGDPVPYAAAP